MTEAVPFDVYPFILLNLVLSCVAAIQAPVIMMSQNRQSSRDRLGARHDYEIDLKSEMEVMGLYARWMSCGTGSGRSLATSSARSKVAAREGAVACLTTLAETGSTVRMLWQQGQVISNCSFMTVGLSNLQVL